MKLTTKFLLGLVAATMLSTSAISAGSSSSSSGGSRGGSSSYSSGGSSYSRPPPSAPSTSTSPSTYSKPTATTPSVATTPSTPSTPTPSASGGGAGYGRPAAVGAAVGAAGVATTATATPSKPATPPPSAINSAAQRTMSANSLSAYQAERRNASTPPRPIDTASIKNDAGFSSARSSFRSTDDYMTRRSSEINIYRDRNPNIYVINHGLSPNYGVYDSGFLTGMMLGAVGNAAANSMWMYSHYNDPWYRDWRRDLDRKAVDDAELRTKLAAMDAQIAELKAKNVAVPSTVPLPPGVSPALAIAPEAMIASADTGYGFWAWFWIYFGIVVLVALVLILSLSWYGGKK